jgi:predicted amidophosphoribosyltransferase
VNFRLDAQYESGLDDIKKEQVTNQATTSKFSDKLCPWCGDAVKRRRPNAIFCCSRCLEEFHRDRKCGAVRIKRRPKRRRLVL